MNTIDITTILGSELKSRTSARDFAKYLQNMEIVQAQVDFAHVKSVTRSFMDEFYYLLVKDGNAQGVQLQLVNLSEQAREFLKAVKVTADAQQSFVDFGKKDVSKLDGKAVIDALLEAGIFGYIWLAPVGCHMNVGVLNMAFKYLFRADKVLANKVAGLLFYGFGMPAYMLLIVFWLPMMIIQFRAFSKGFTPYPKKARWFCVLIGMIPALILSAVFGLDSALGSGIGTMFLSFGNTFMFGGLLATLPDQQVFDRFQEKNAISMDV